MAEAFGVAASALAVIELSAKIVKICAQYTKDVANARQDIQRLQKEVESLRDVAKSVEELSKNTAQRKLITTEKMQTILDEGRTRLAELQAKLDPGDGKKPMSRIGLRTMKWPFSSKDMRETLTDLARLTIAISLAISVDQTTILLSLEHKSALAKLPIAEGAAFDSFANQHDPQCLEDTRTDVLHEITEWVQNPSSKAVYWLNGMAGTGKSTISRTIANKFSKRSDPGARLGAAFFFKRGEGDRGNMSKFFTTIASQLIQRLPEIAGRIQTAIEVDPGLIWKDMRDQFETLIVGPITTISSVNTPHRIFLFVIDALDECEREEDVKLLIKLLSGFARATTIQLKFFLTSRPELRILCGFNSVDGQYEDFILHEVAGPIIEHDLQVYLEHELERTRLAFNQGLPENRRVPANWLNPTDLGSLVQMATPLFIFAATTCRFIADRKSGNPRQKLRHVLKFRSAQGSKLEATYMPVLEQLTMDLAPKEQSDMLSQFHRIVGPIVVLADSLGSEPLSRLLDIDADEIMDLLDFLHSVLQVPSLPEQPIRLLHLSFRDFLVDPERQANPFWINERKIHQELAEQCLRILNSSLKKDICNVKAPGTLTSSISASVIKTSIPPELQYACRFWVYHLRESSSHSLDTANLWEFLRSHFLHWLEALSWMGRLPESFGIVTALQSISRTESDHEIAEFLKDSVRFLQAAKSSIQIAPLQAYSSSLAFAPTQSIVRRTYEDDVPDSIVIGPQMPFSWDDRLQTFEVHSDTIVRIAFLSDGKLLGAAFSDGTVILLAADTGEHRLRVEGRTFSASLSAFSPDGMLLASVSQDGVLILWSVTTGKRQQTFDISSETFCSLAISPDNELLALTSVDHTIVLWEINTGKRRKIQSGHSAWIHSIEFSPDNKLLVSASKDQTIILWDTKKAEKQRTLKAHTSAVKTVAFSRGSELLASASDDGTIILWRTKTGQQQHSFQGYASQVTSIAFSPDGKLLASACRNGNVFLWAAETGKRLRTFEGGVHEDNYVSFSPDGKRLMATSGHGSISIWITDTVDCGQRPEKHSESVNVMGFSPDSKLLASTGEKGSVILWRPDTGEHMRTLEGHSSWINGIAFSPDSKLLATVSTDKTSVLWTVDTGERWQTLRGHTGSVTNAVFSPDGKMLGTASHDKTAAIWATDTGELSQSLRGHTDIVRTVAFSLDGKMLATASDDKTVALWATDTGVRERTLEGHSKGIVSIAFSPDGKMLASASNDRTVALWATDTGERRQVFGGYSTIFREIVFLRDSKLVALDSGGPVIIGTTETDEGRQMPLESGHNNSSVKVDQSALSTANVQRSSASPPPSGSNGTECIGPGISQDGCWISFNGEPILWLPLEYRPHRAAVSGHVIAIGCRSGRVLFVRPGRGK